MVISEVSSLRRLSLSASSNSPQALPSGPLIALFCFCRIDLGLVSLDFQRGTAMGGARGRPGPRLPFDWLWPGFNLACQDTEGGGSPALVESGKLIGQSCGASSGCTPR